jgi:hypothetical protein
VLQHIIKIIPISGLRYAEHGSARIAAIRKRATFIPVFLFFLVSISEELLEKK